MTELVDSGFDKPKGWDQLTDREKQAVQKLIDFIIRFRAAKKASHITFYLNTKGMIEAFFNLT
jgi:hypothetical protein